MIKLHLSHSKKNNITITKKQSINVVHVQDNFKKKISKLPMLALVEARTRVLLIPVVDALSMFSFFR